MSLAGIYYVKQAGSFIWACLCFLRAGIEGWGGHTQITISIRIGVHVGVRACRCVCGGGE